MPTYDYACSACGHRFERFQSITAAPVRTCPRCGRRKVRRLIGTGAGVLFRGSGFYQTDYRSESYKKAAEKDKPAGDGGSASSDGKTKGKGSAEGGGSSGGGSSGGASEAGSSGGADA
jgi:putative FmdB family regulatory protein